MQYRSAIYEFIRSQFIAVLATADARGPRACPIYYVVDGESLVFQSRTTAEHSEIMVNQPAVALAIYDGGSTYLEKIGVQLLGTVAQIETAAELEAVRERFAAHPALRAMAKKLQDPSEFLGTTVGHFYRFTPTQAKIVDTRRGQHVYSDWEAV